MKQLLFSLSRFAVVFLASSIVFFALLVVTVRSLIPYFNHRVDVIERLATHVLHKSIQISHFAVVWRGLTPVFRAGQVIVWNDERTRALLQVEQLDVSVDLFKSVFTGNITLGEVRGRGIALFVHQTQDNQWTCNGMPVLFNQTPSVVSSSTNEALVWLLTEPVLHLQDIRLIFYPKIGPKWPEMHFNVILKNTQDHHKLSAQLRFLGERAENLHVTADITTIASPATLSQAKVHMYLEGHAVSLEKWTALLTTKYSLQDGLVNFKVWVDWQQDHFKQIHALLDSTEHSVLHLEKQPSIKIMPFFADVRWAWPVHSDWYIDAMVQDLSFSSWKKMPGMKGLNAYCHIAERTGRLWTRSKNIALDFKTLFKAPIHLNTLTSELIWQVTPDGVSIQIPTFNAENADLSINAQMALLLPKSKKNAQIGVLAHLKTDRPSRIAYYLPLPFMANALTHWLNSALIKGSGDGVLLLQGPLFEFPFDKNNGIFLVNTQIKNAELHYQSAWPNIKNIDAELIFSGRQMKMQVDSGKILGIYLNQMQATIPMIKKHVQTVLHVVVNEIHTCLEDGLAFLAATPLVRNTGDLLSSLHLSGPVQFALKLTIPLASGKEHFKVVGLGTTKHALVQIPFHHIQIQDVQGQFLVSQAGVQAQNLQGILWNKPITIGIGYVPNIRLTMLYNGIQTILNSEKNGWRFSVDNNIAQGSVLIPNNTQRAIEANFNTLILQSVLSSQSQAWKPKQIPKINFHAHDVRYKAMDFGGVHVKLRPLVGGVAIEELQAGNSNYHLILKGVWHGEQHPWTDIKGRLDTLHVSSFLKSLGLPASISAEQTYMRFDLRWPGVPYKINVTSMRGGFSFRASKGQIVDIGSSAEAKLGFGRLLTFLSLQSLGRRLQLDFSDLKGNGFDFTELQGHFTLRAGHAFTRDTVIEGPVAVIAIRGRIGLLTKDYDLVIKIRPHFTSSLPVIVGLAGGPIAGAVTWMANAVLGATVQKIAETTYHLTGTWGRPTVSKTSV